MVERHVESARASQGRIPAGHYGFFVGVVRCRVRSPWPSMLLSGLWSMSQFGRVFRVGVLQSA